MGEDIGYMPEPVIAYVLIKTGVGKTDAVLNDILKISQVSKAVIVTGEYDIVVELVGKDVDKILSTIAHEIRQIRDVEKTKTLIGASIPYSPRAKL